jgi:hypothetical protein
MNSKRGCRPFGTRIDIIECPGTAVPGFHVPPLRGWGCGRPRTAVPGFHMPSLRGSGAR